MTITLFLILMALAIAIITYPYKRKFKPLQLLIALLFAICVSAGYWQWGGWKGLAEYNRQQAALKSFKNPQEVIDKLKQHLNSSPKSARGWFLLGRLYASRNQWSEAVDAFNRAHLLEPNNEQTTVNYAQSLWQNNHQIFNATIRGLFLSILKVNPNQPDALSMLAIDAFQERDYSIAKHYWTHLLSLVPPDSEDANAIRKAIKRCPS